MNACSGECTIVQVGGRCVRGGCGLAEGDCCLKKVLGAWFLVGGSCVREVQRWWGEFYEVQDFAGLLLNYVGLEVADLSAERLKGLKPGREARLKPADSLERPRTPS